VLQQVWHVNELSLHPLTSVSEGMITVRLSNKEIVITAVKIVITADSEESKFEIFVKML
jgi:hypothetical protein